ncbi:3-methylorcinaldehyde synthase tropA [Bienertia sinuspersici]
MWWRDIDVSVVSYSHNHVAVDVCHYDGKPNLAKKEGGAIRGELQMDSFRIKEIEKQLKYFQSHRPDQAMLARCNELADDLDDLHRLEESYWHTRARDNEIRDGDKNMSYFYHKASQRRRRNYIKGLYDESGNWSNINVWSDTLVKGENGGHILVPNGSHDMNLRVSDLIDHETSSWNVEMIRIKSGYWLARLGNVNLFNSDGNNVKTWRSIWNLENYAFKDIVATAPSTSFQDRWAWLSVKLDKSNQIMAGTLAWAAWLCRNKAVFESPVSCNISTAVGFMHLVDEYNNYAARAFKSCPNSTSVVAKSWCKPPQGLVKVNTDAHVLNGIKVSLGAVCRNGEDVILATTTKVIHPTSVDVAEAEAARFGVTIARRLNFNSIILECDSSNTHSLINAQQEVLSPLLVIVKDIHVLMSGFSYFKCFLVRRSSNTIAHLVARLDTIGCNERVFLGSFPQSVLTLAEMNISSN